MGRSMHLRETQVCYCTHLVSLYRRETLGLLLQAQQEGRHEVVQNHPVADYCPTVRDMNKTHKTDPSPYVGVALYGEHIFNFR